MRDNVLREDQQVCLEILDQNFYTLETIIWHGGVELWDLYAYSFEF